MMSLLFWGGGFIVTPECACPTSLYVMCTCVGFTGRSVCFKWMTSLDGFSQTVCFAFASSSRWMSRILASGKKKSHHSVFPPAQRKCLSSELLRCIKRSVSFPRLSGGKRKYLNWISIAPKTFSACLFLFNATLYINLSTHESRWCDALPCLLTFFPPGVRFTSQ